MPAMLHTSQTAPWDASGGESHMLCARAAARIADDISANDRWGDEPAYRPEDGSYVGDARDDRVRCHSDYLFLHPRKGTGLVTQAEWVYLALFPAAARWAALRDELTRLVACGALTADEPIEDAATRLLDNGYSVETLRDEAATTADPVGLAEIAERLGVDRATADQWRTRKLLPAAPWTVGGRPAWPWPVIEAWARQTGRLPAAPVTPA